MTAPLLFVAFIGFLFGALPMALYALHQWDAGYRAGHHDGHRQAVRTERERAAQRDAWRVRP